jgi:hypothetical protein
VRLLREIKGAPPPWTPRTAGSYAVVWPTEGVGAAVWYRAVGFLLAVTESTSTKVSIAHLGCP